MELLELLVSPERVPADPVLVAALDGWTDAGQGGTTAAAALLDGLPALRVGRFPSDALYDYRDRRPSLAIRQGILDDPEWPELVIDLLEPASGPPLLLLHGAEPDLSWQTIGADLVELAELVDASRYVGLGAVPGPIPHTRPVQVICTASDVALLERYDRPHEEVVVPASCQVALEALLRDADVETLGLWVRIPHYVAGEYPEAAQALLQRLSAHLGTPVDLGPFEAVVSENRAKLDVAASSSDEVSDHVRQLERLYDAEQQAERDLTFGTERTLSEEQVPSADELAAEIERFLRGRTD